VYEAPFLIAQSREDQNKRVYQNDTFAGGTFDAKVFLGDLFEVAQLSRKFFDRSKVGEFVKLILLFENFIYRVNDYLNDF
jgi:hypothetical protein